MVCLWVGSSSSRQRFRDCRRLLHQRLLLRPCSIPVRISFRGNLIGQTVVSCETFRCLLLLREWKMIVENRGFLRRFTQSTCEVCVRFHERVGFHSIDFGPEEHTVLVFGVNFDTRIWQGNQRQKLWIDSFGCETKSS